MDIMYLLCAGLYGGDFQSCEAQSSFIETVRVCVRVCVCSLHVLLIQTDDDANRNIDFYETEEMRLLHRWEDNIRMDVTEIAWKGVEWLNLAQSRNQWLL
jgi:hypothetical protein